MDLSNMEDVKLRADAIEAAVKLAIVAQLNDGEEYRRDADVTFDRFSLRAAVAMAVSLYADENRDMIEAIGKLTRK